MKPIWISAAITVVLWLVRPIASAQTYIDLSNGGLFTRIGSPVGPLAGTNIMAQFLIGKTPESLSPIFSAVAHYGPGKASLGIQFLADWEPRQLVSVQMAAWDASIWGSNYFSVPESQIGRTGVAQVWLPRPGTLDTLFRPEFGTPAIVPIPEPRVSLLLIASGVLVSWFRWQRTRDGPLAGGRS